MAGSERRVRPPFRSAEQDAKQEASLHAEARLRAGERTPLRVLIVEGSEDEAAPLLRELRCGGYESLYGRVGNPEAMEEALARQRWDLVLAGTCAPLLSAARALALVRQKGPNLPFILVAEKIDEDAAVALIKDGGVHDYVPKDGLGRLGPATERALREAESRKKKPAGGATIGAEAEYRTLFENAAEGIFQSTADGRIKTANPALALILGYASPEELVSNVRDVTHRLCAEPDYREAFLEQMRCSGAVSGFEARALRRDGSTTWCSLNARATYDEAGEMTGFEGFVEDISGRKRTEEALYESEERFRSTFEQAASGMAHMALDGRILRANERLREITGYSEEELLEKTFQEITHSEDRGSDLEQAHQLLAGEIDSYSMEKRYLRKDGSTVWVNITRSLRREPTSGEPKYFITVAQDISERKQTEAVLLQSLKKLEELKSTIDASAIVAFTEAAIIAFTDQRGKITYVNEKFCQISKYSKAELIGQDHRLINSGYHPKEYIRNLWRTIAQGKVWQGELRNRAKDGSIYWVDTTIVPFLDERGKPYRYVAIRHDITERKLAEEALRGSEELYRTVIEQAAENIFLIDQETKQILEANNALHRSLGYTAEELRQLRLYDFVAHDKESIDSNIQRILEDGGSFLGERKYRRKDGSLISVEVSASPISYGGREAMCVTAHDVTERKQAEATLRRSLDALLALYEAGHVLGSTLEVDEVGTRLLRIMQRVSRLSTAVISTPDEHGYLRVWRAVGSEALPENTRDIPEIQSTLQRVLESGEDRVLRYEDPGENGESSMVLVVLPLRIQNRTIGLLEAYGPEEMLEEDAVEILSGLASQARSALENARLYGALAERERQLEDLVGKLLTAQEEERHRVAYEVHDGLAQVAVAAHQRLQAFSRRFSPPSEKGRTDLDRILKLVQQSVEGSRQIIANLRPTVLDDFGLAGALRQEVESLREVGWQVDYEEDIAQMGDKRLPASVEVALFRVAQEALINARKHAQTRRVRLVLRCGQEAVNLKVQDWGRGFDPEALGGGTKGPGERIGLSGMRERVSLLGGEFEVHSRPAEGTSITARVPLGSSEESEQREEEAV